MIKKCLFPAAGYGTRFLPATKAIPKEMLPIINKPLLQYGVEEALSAGINDMAIVTGRGKRAIEDHFDRAFELETELKEHSKEYYVQELNEIMNLARFTYVRQKDMLGLGHAILSGETLIGNEAFAVILADDLCTNNEDENILVQMIEIFNKYKCSVIAVEEIDYLQSNQYGIISGKLFDDSSNLYQVDSLIEKPSPENAPSNLAIIGRYVLTPDIFNILKSTKPGKSGEIELTDALLGQAKNGKVIAYKHNAIRFDCGSIRGYLEATNYFANVLNILSKG
jgi:UTP--glucose-1-phosphate uridylyltransferase